MRTKNIPLRDIFLRRTISAFLAGKTVKQMNPKREKRIFLFYDSKIMIEFHDNATQFVIYNKNRKIKIKKEKIIPNDNKNDYLIGIKDINNKTLVFSVPINIIYIKENEFLITEAPQEDEVKITKILNLGFIYYYKPPAEFLCISWWFFLFILISFNKDIISKSQ